MLQYAAAFGTAGELRQSVDSRGVIPQQFMNHQVVAPSASGLLDYTALWPLRHTLLYLLHLQGRLAELGSRPISFAELSFNNYKPANQMVRHCGIVCNTRLAVQSQCVPLCLTIGMTSA